MYVCMYVICVYIYIYIYMCMCVYIYIYIYICTPHSWASGYASSDNPFCQTSRGGFGTRPYGTLLGIMAGCA